MLVSRECNGRKLSPNHIAKNIHAKLTSKASSSTAYIFRRELRVVCVSAELIKSVGGIMGETRIRLAPSTAAR